MINSLAILNNEFISALGLRTDIDNVNGTKSIGNYTRKPREQEPIKFWPGQARLGLLMSAFNKQLHRFFSPLSLSLRAAFR